MTPAGSTAARRTAALGRAELTLLGRNRTALATALLLPAGMVGAWSPTLARLAPGGARVSAGELAVSSGIGFVLLFVVYYNLVTAYVARREERVLKRLRTGEPTDIEILAGTALPAVALALAQCAAMVAAGVALLHLPLPHRPELLLAGVALGVRTAGGVRRRIHNLHPQRRTRPTHHDATATGLGGRLRAGGPVGVDAAAAGRAVPVAADDRGDGAGPGRLDRRSAGRAAGGAAVTVQRAGLDTVGRVCCTTPVPLGTTPLRTRRKTQ